MLRLPINEDQLLQIPESVGSIYLVQIAHRFRIHANHQALRPSSLILQTGICRERRGKRQKLRLVDIALIHAVQCLENAHLQMVLRRRRLPRSEHLPVFHVIYNDIRIGSAGINSYSDHIIKNSFSVFHTASFVFNRALELQLVYKNVLKAAL